MSSPDGPLGEPSAPLHPAAWSQPSAGSDEPWAWPELEPMRPASLRREAIVPVAVALSIGVLGAGVGWLWAVLAPRVTWVKVEGGYIFADEEPEQAAAADGWFLLLGAGLGVLLAIAVWVALRRYRGVVMLVGLTLGSLLGATVAWWVGHRIGLTQFNRASASAAVGTRIEAPLGLRITNLDPHRWWLPQVTGVAAAQALTAAFTYTCLAGFSVYDDLRGPERRRRAAAAELAAVWPGAATPAEPGAAGPGGDDPADPDGWA
jgi:hypothetical protein